MPQDVGVCPKAPLLRPAPHIALPIPVPDLELPELAEQECLLAPPTPPKRLRSLSAATTDSGGSSAQSFSIMSPRFLASIPRSALA
jgi:hypothetical protein